MATAPTQTAQEQSKTNSAPDNKTTAGDPRPVETIDAPLVFANGNVVEAPGAGGDDKTYTLFHPGGTRVEVVGSARRDEMLARGYSTSRPSRDGDAAS